MFGKLADYVKAPFSYLAARFRKTTSPPQKYKKAKVLDPDALKETEKPKEKVLYGPLPKEAFDLRTDLHYGNLQERLKTSQDDISLYAAESALALYFDGDNPQPYTEKSVPWRDFRGDIKDLEARTNQILAEKGSGRVRLSLGVRKATGEKRLRISYVPNIEGISENFSFSAEESPPPSPAKKA